MQGALLCRGLASYVPSVQRQRKAQPVFGCARRPQASAECRTLSHRTRQRLAPSPSFADVCNPGRPLKAVRRRSFAVSARYNSSPEIGERIIGSLPYLVPLFDGVKLSWSFIRAGMKACKATSCLQCCVRFAGLRYGKFLFLQFPLFGQILAPLDPLIRLYFSFPFARYVAQIPVGRAWLTEDASVKHVFLCLSICASINHTLLYFRLLVEREIWCPVL